MEIQERMEGGRTGEEGATVWMSWLRIERYLSTAEFSTRYWCDICLNISTAFQYTASTGFYVLEFVLRPAYCDERIGHPAFSV
jgi:hypothetical protein